MTSCSGAGRARYGKFSVARDSVIRVYDESGSVLETHEQPLSPASPVAGL